MVKECFNSLQPALMRLHLYIQGKIFQKRTANMPVFIVDVCWLESLPHRIRHHVLNQAPESMALLTDKQFPLDHLLHQGLAEAASAYYPGHDSMSVMKETGCGIKQRAWKRECSLRGSRLIVNIPRVEGFLSSIFLPVRTPRGS